ncbi:MAG TPA: hypothetical protein VMW91_08225 [Desulfosporosinus sp.]|nr:hypothetical protein [Desulfosporosinus sp.]
MKAYKIKKYIIAADLPEDAENIFIHEIGETLPEEAIEEVSLQLEICCDDGRVMTIKEIINEELDERQEWRRLGVHCETYRPFIVKILT